MAILPGTIAEVTWKYAVNGQICLSIFHYTYVTGSTTADGITATSGLLTKVSDISNPLLVAISNAQALNASYISASAQLIYPIRYLRFTSDISLVGALPLESEAQNVACVITKQTQFSGRDAVGSFHLGGVSSSSYANGFISDAQKTRMEFIGTQMLANITDATNSITWVPSLLNKEPIPDTDPVRYRIKGSTLLYTFIVQQTLRVMRRRTVGLGI